MKSLIVSILMLVGFEVPGQPFPSVLKQILTTNHIANPPADGWILTTSNGLPLFEQPSVVTNNDLWWQLNPLNGSITNVNGGGASIGPGTNGAVQVYFLDSSGTFVLGGFDTNNHSGFFGLGLPWTNSSGVVELVSNTLPILLGNTLATPANLFSISDTNLSGGGQSASAIANVGGHTANGASVLTVTLTGTPSDNGFNSALSGNNFALGNVAGATYFGQGAIGIAGNGGANSGGLTNAGIGISGYANGHQGLLSGGVREADASMAGTTNVGGIDNVLTEGKSGQFVAHYSEARITPLANGTDDPIWQSAIELWDNRESNFPLVVARTNKVQVATLDTNGLWTANGFIDGSGSVGKVVAYGTAGRLVSTNIEQLITNVTFNTLYATNIYATNITAQTVNNITNIFNVSKGGNLIITNTISYITNTWSQGPTGVVQVATNHIQNFVSLTACSITGITGKTANQAEDVLMTFYNTAGTNWNLTLQAGIVEATGGTLTVPAGGIGMLWIHYNPQGPAGATGETNAVFHFFPSTPALGGPFVRTIDIPMGAWFTNNCGNGADVSVASMVTLTNSGDTPVFTVNATTTNEIRTRFSLPRDWDANSVQIHTFWACSGTNSAAQSKTNIVVHYDAAAVGPADRLDNLTFGTAVYWTNNVNPFPYEQGTEGITSGLTVGNSPAAGKGIVWRIQVDGNTSGTTETNSSLYLAHFTIEYRSIPTNTFSATQ